MRIRAFCVLLLTMPLTAYSLGPKVVLGERFAHPSHRLIRTLRADEIPDV